jgi:hypothetical protein
MKAACLLSFLALAAATAAASELTLSNDLVQATWQIGDHGPTAGSVEYKPTGQKIALDGELFSLVLQDGTYLKASQMKAVGGPKTTTFPGYPKASRMSNRLPHKLIRLEMVDNDGNLHVEWCAVLCDGSPYLRQAVSLQVAKKAIPVKEILLIDIPMAAARSSGRVDGSPAVTDTAFFAVEHPMSINRGELGRVRCFLPWSTGLEPSEELVTVPSVIGFVPKGQLRRGFLAYLERERAHPYRPFLNYNTWYDIGYFSRFDAAAAIDAINGFGQELVEKRKTRIDSFLLGRRLGRLQKPLAAAQGFSRRLRPRGRGGQEVRRRAGLLALALGRLRPAQGRAPQAGPRGRF